MLNFQGVRLGRPLQPLGMFQVSEIWKSSMELERFLPHSSSLYSMADRDHAFCHPGTQDAQWFPGWVGGSSGHRNSPLEVVPICEVNQQKCHRPWRLES